MTSAIALLEVVVSYFVEEKNLSQKKATLIFAGIIWTVGILCALSFNVFKGTVDFFDIFDKVTSNILMPMGGMLTAAFFGWVVPRSEIARVVGSDGLLCSGLIWISRVLAPIAVSSVMIGGLIDWLS